jgi:putative membrane protein
MSFPTISRVFLAATAALALFVASCQCCKAASTGTTSSSSLSKSVSSNDKLLMKNMSASYQLQMAVLGTASRKDENPTASALATKLVTEVKKSWTDFANLAQSKEIEIAAEVARGDKRDLEPLAKAKGPKYDKEVIEFLGKEMKKLARMVENGAKGANDADIKAWMERTVPVVAGWQASVAEAEKAASEKKK